ncbi:MAG: hypothetical protein Q8K96_10910 [Rubrivivax sp.]|nr:hypothetical protein [Rubrivivax sp.]
MHRRHALLSLTFPATALAQSQDIAPANPVDSVAAYVIPTDNISEQAAAVIARALTKDTGLWIKSTLWTPSGEMEPFPGTNQYPAEDYFALGASAMKLLRDASVRTYFIVLTDRDINSKSRNFRYQYSMHSPMARTSVLSIARLQHEKDGSLAPGDVVATRAAKMLLRIVGEMRLGWRRTADPTDLMYAPLTSIEDIDRMSLIHTVQRRRQAK